MKIVFPCSESLVGGLAKTVTKFLQTLGEHFEKFSSALKEWAVKFSELINKLTPLVTEAIGNISRAFAGVITTFLEIFSRVSGKILEALKANSADIQKIFSIFSDFIKGNLPNFQLILYFNNILFNLQTKACS